MTVEHPASVAAQRIQRRYPELFREAPIKVSVVAEKLGVRVVRSRTLTERAMLHILPGVDGEVITAYVQAGIKADYGRFALAHELGHAYLHSEGSEVAKSLAPNEVEFFCHRFAGELLVPPKFRKDIRRHFIEASKSDSGLSVKNIAEAIQNLGISVSAFFSTITPHMSEVLSGTRSAIILARTAAHPYPSIERRKEAAPTLRVVQRLFDPEYFFFPRYQRLASLLDPIDWLMFLEEGQTKTQLLSAKYSVRLSPAKVVRTRFERRNDIVPVSVQRLSPISGLESPTFLVMLHLA